MAVRTSRPAGDWEDTQSVGVTQRRDHEGEIAEQRIDRIVEWLETNIGPRTCAYAAATSRGELSRIAHGDSPPPDMDRRLRNLYAVCAYFATADGAGSAHDWLVEPNPELDDRAPAELLHDGAPPERLWLAAVPPF